MRLTVLCAALLLAATACTAPGPANTNMTTNANTAATPKATPISDAEAIAQEQKVWDTIKNKNFDAFAAYLADDQIEITDHSRNTKADTLNEIKGLAVTDVTNTDWKVVHVDSDVYVITYTTNWKGTYQGHDLSATPTRSSTAWVNRAGKWLAVYHQSTDVKPMPAASPSAATSPSASPSASTAASPSASTSPAADPTALENQVWDALKRRDYTAFGNFLADDSVEVEPDGVFDKAGSISGVQQFDASKYTLSDFAVTKIDDDASLVTYIVHAPAPSTETERHSTIWARRNGKWLAVFHQGTPQAGSQSTTH